MKSIPFILLCLCSVASAQDRWVGQDFIWQFSDGGPCLPHDPCFGPDSNSMLLMNPEYNRIMLLHFDAYDTLEQFLPESLSVDGYGDMSPFLTPDGQSLYFSSNRPGGNGGVDIWVTHRVDNVWQMPVNLGPTINSERNEYGPSLTADGTELYFCLADTPNMAWPLDNGVLMKSSLVNDQWTPAESLLVPIHSQYGERDPAISADGRFLYFISYINNSYEGSAWVSQSDGNNWLQPVLLDGFINQIWEECAFMPEGYPYSVALDQSRRRLLYTKEEIYECWDPESKTYISYLATGIGNDQDIIPEAPSLSLYPNPFNSSLAINANNASQIAIYDLLGRKIRTFSNNSDNAVIWDGRSDEGVPCASGIYFVRAAGGERTIVKAATLLK